MQQIVISHSKIAAFFLLQHLFANKKAFLIVCISLSIILPLTYNIIYSSIRSSYSHFISERIQHLGAGEEIRLSRQLNYSVSLERDALCNLNNRSSCYRTNKSLVVTFWRESSRNKWLAKNFLKIFDDEHFVRIVMIHDNSIWSNYTNKDLFIWIYVNAQKRFWYVKRFLTPEILRAYKFIWILDDDVELLFNPLHYECVATELNISLSSPGRVKGIASHDIMKVNKDYVDKIGRWTDFVEIGPIVVSTVSAWECIWHFLSPFGGLGWGLDLVWCRLLAHNCQTNATLQKTCAILDSFEVNHLSDFIGSTVEGGKERPNYDAYYGNFHTQQLNHGPLANDRKIFSSCLPK